MRPNPPRPLRRGTEPGWTPLRPGLVLLLAPLLFFPPGVQPLAAQTLSAGRDPETRLGPAPVQVSQQDPPGVGALTVLGFTGSAAGLLLGGALGYQLDRRLHPYGEVPGLWGALVGGTAGSGLGAASFAAAWDGRERSFVPAVTAALLGTVVALAVTQALGDASYGMSGLLAIPLSQTVGAVLAVQLLD